MSWFNALVLLVIVWWIVLFAVLPLGTTPAVDPDRASGWRGAPERPALGRKFLITTLVSLVIWGLCVAVITSGGISFRSGIFAVPRD